MSETRQPRLIACCGRKGVGKTFTTVRYLRQYVQGDAAQGIRGRKVLIFDVNNEYSDKTKYPDIRAIRMQDVPLFSAKEYGQVAEMRRVMPFFDSGEPMTTDDMARVLQWLVTTFKNGLLLIEDINKYITDSMPGDLIGAICTNRHTGVDIIMHYQSVGRLTPKVWQNINQLRFHKNTDYIRRHKNKVEDHLECLSIAETIVNRQYKKNRHYYLWVDFDEQKIHSGLPYAFIKECVAEYVAENYSHLVAPLLTMRTARGKAYTAESAMKAAHRKLLDQYFDLDTDPDDEDD